MKERNEPDWEPLSDAVLQDPVGAHGAMQSRCPVAYSELFSWSLFRHEDVTRVLDDHHTFSSVVSQHRSVPNGMDPPEHTAYRRVLEPFAAPFAVRCQCAFLGWPPELVEPLRRWTRQNQEATLALDRERLAQLARGLRGYVDEMLAYLLAAGRVPVASWPAKDNHAGLIEGELDPPQLANFADASVGNLLAGAPARATD